MILSHVLYVVECQADEDPLAPILPASSATGKGHDLIFSSPEKSRQLLWIIDHPNCGLFLEKVETLVVGFAVRVRLRSAPHT
jgi:hypothetical protein